MSLDWEFLNRYKRASKMKKYERKGYEIPPGKTHKERLTALYAREPPNDERVKEGLVEGYMSFGLSKDEALLKVTALF